jgi:hypothetical protein
MAEGRRQPALARAVNSMMRALGGACVTLRTPVASSDGLNRELGITASLYQDAQVAPVIVRDVAEKDGRQQIEVLISSAALDALMPAVGVADKWEFLRSVEQVVYAQRTFAVTDVSADRFAGVAYLFHVTAVASSQ